MRFLLRWLRRLVGTAFLLVLALLAPILYVEALCRGQGDPGDYQPILSPEHRRAEVKTLLTYPEWHIVHAYDDYAKVIAEGDPHEFGYLRAIGGFWSSLCALDERSAALSGDTGGIKQTVYVIGVSFTAELLAKAVYEETLGRIATWIRGDIRAPLDDLSAKQAADYARFLQQTPWYKWDFAGDIAALEAAQTDILRDTERRFALGVEYGGKAVYAQVIADAVASVGADALTLRMVVAAPAGALDDLEAVTIIDRRQEGIVIETPRYRALTLLLTQMAARGVEFIEIAGNDDILLTATSPENTAPDALFTFPRQGYGDYRHLIALKVPELAARLRGFTDDSAALEHVHDY
jgi:hypothetical protein